MESVWAGIIGAVAGALVGGGIALFGEWRHVERDRGEQRRVAVMQIASQLRIWLIDTTHAFYEASYAQPTEDQDPNRDVFPAPGDIPPFPFDDSLATISLLQSGDAQSLFNVIARRRDAEKDAKHTAFLRDNEEAAEIFEARIAGLYVECAAIYTKMAKQVDWSGSAVTEQEIATMRQKAENLNEILNRPSDIDLGST